MKVLPSEYNFLIPLNTPSLNRLGVKKDGGYILDEDLLKLSNFLISFGMADEYSFEEDFLKYNKNNSLIIFDFSISHGHYIKDFFKNIRRILKFQRNLNDLIICIKNYFNFIKFTNNKKVKFYSKKINNQVNSSKDITVQEIFENIVQKDKQNITLKIDIEGSEYDIVDKILLYENQIDQLIMEYHDTHKRKEEFFENIKKIKNFFYISHLHANNYQNYNSDGFPINIEISFCNKRYLKDNCKQSFRYPVDKLDYPNNPNLKDLEFSFRNKHND